MTNDKKKLLGHGMACGTQIMWGATFVSTKVLLSYFLPAEVLFTRALLAFFTLLLFYPHHLKLKTPKQELAFAGAGLFGIVLYFMLENTALTMTYASNVGIIVACAPFFVAVMVGFFFKNERSGIYFYIGFVVAIAGVILISLNGQKNLQLNPLGDGLAFLAMISWGCYSALVRKIGEWEYPVIAVTRRIYFYGILFLIPVLLQQHASWKPELLLKPEVFSNTSYLLHILCRHPATNLRLLRSFPRDKPVLRLLQVRLTDSIPCPRKIYSNHLTGSFLLLLRYDQLNIHDPHSTIHNSISSPDPDASFLSFVHFYCAFFY